MFKKTNSTKNSFVYNNIKKSEMNNYEYDNKIVHKKNTSSNGVSSRICPYLDNGFIMDNNYPNNMNTAISNSNRSNTNKLNISRSDDIKGEVHLESSSSKKLSEEKIYKVSQRIESIKQNYNYSNHKVTTNSS